MNASGMYILLEDVRSNSKSKILYGSAGHPVSIISISGHVAIVEGPDGERFSVHLDKLRPMVMNNKRINTYTCQAGHFIVAVDLHTGITPMFIPCSHKGCRNQATSAFYEVAGTLVPQYEWYRPTEKELTAHFIQMDNEHQDKSQQYKQWLKDKQASIRLLVANGGLIMREIKSNK